MTTKDIQQVLRTLHRDSLERGLSLWEMRQQKPDSDSDFRAFFAALEARALKYWKPGPGRTALALGSFSVIEQAQIEEYAERLISEAQALCLRIQERCPTLGKADRDVDGLYRFERWYRAQLHAMERLRRRCDSGQWIHAHMMKARRWLEEAYVESVN